MPSTITRSEPTNGAKAETAAAESTPDSASRGESPPPVNDSRASFALFASFMAMLIALAALLAVSFKLDDQQGTAGNTQAATSPSAGGTAAPTAPQGSAGGSVKIVMGDYTFTPPDATAAAGKVKITAPNDGQLVHELVLARTNADPSKLPTTSDGSVDEEALNSPGEIADVAAGATKRGTFNLKAGNYVMFCNVPGHYAQGMYGTLTVD
jgi:uncharacterized cupredoxin-like copper-binding protein